MYFEVMVDGDTRNKSPLLFRAFLLTFIPCEAWNLLKRRKKLCSMGYLAIGQMPACGRA
jgi:hypothetical protein